MVIKTRTSRVAELSTFITKKHPYDVPEVIAMPVRVESSAKAVDAFKCRSSPAQKRISTGWNRQ